MPRKILIPVVLMVGLLGLYAAAGFYLLPRVARDQLPQWVSESTGQMLQLREVRFNPFEFQLDLQGVVLLAEQQPLLSLDALVVDIAVVESIRQPGLVLRLLSLQHPVVNVERNQQGRFNFMAWLEGFQSNDQADSQPSDSRLPLIKLHQVKLQSGQLNWRDFSLPEAVNETLEALDFSLSEFSTAPESPCQFLLTLALASGGELNWQGQFDLTSLTSDGDIKLDDLALSHVWLAALQGIMPLQITDGFISLAANYQLDGIEQLLLKDGNVEIKSLALKEQGQDDILLQLPLFTADGIRLDLKKQQVHITSFSSKGADIKAWLQQDGRLNYQRLFAGDAPAEELSPQRPEPTEPWQIKLDKLSLSDYRLVFTDYTQSKPLPIRLDNVNVLVADYANSGAIPVPMQFSSRINDTGQVKIAGKTGLSPFSADWRLDLQGLKLKPFQSYFEPFLNLEMADGELSSQGQLQINPASPMQLVYRGDANISNLVTRDRVKNLDFVKWDNLLLKEMTLDAGKQDYKLGQVIFEQPYVRFTIKKDGGNNFQDVLASKPPAKAASEKKTDGGDSAQANTNPEPVINIGRIALMDGQSDFADYSLILPFVVRMNGLNGDVDGFGSNTDSAAKLQLKGKVRDLAEVNVGGRYQLKSGDSDIALSFKHLPLPLVTPYMAEFAGYKIEKGQMALDLKYSIKQGQLAAENKVFIDQLTLGERVENPKAVSLPVSFAIALLKDEDGKINLDFPVTGSLEEPQFSVGSLLTDVLINIMSKAVSAPFSALSSLFDDEESSSSIGFTAGDSDLNSAESAKLTQIAQALQTKPELILEIKGLAYQNQDWPAMRYDVVLEILKKMKSGELRDQGKHIRSEYIELDEEEHKRLLAKFYAEVFPNNIEYSLFGAPRIKHAPEADFFQLAREELEAVMQPEPQRLNELAVARANGIAKYLIEQGGIDRSRIYILDTELSENDSEGGLKSRLALNAAS